MTRSPDQAEQTWGRINCDELKDPLNSRSSDSGELFVRDYNTALDVPLEEQLGTDAPPHRGPAGFGDTARNGQTAMDHEHDPTVQTYPRGPNQPEDTIQVGPHDPRAAYQKISSDDDDEDDIPLSALRPRTQQSSKSAPAPRCETDPSKSNPQPKYNWRNTPAKPISAKPVLKNDMQAKLHLIREIERYWGKNFIKAYIPKCHRPLTKRKNGKRSVYRVHETDPKNWLPSVLKAILMVATQTDDKVALKRAMNEVVRYRIKHTGNRKPQLVTTDFDVIEDMVIRGWECEDSFKIRYKHLLMAQSSAVHVTNAEVDAIMYPTSEYEDSDDDEPRQKRKRGDASDEEEDGRDNEDEELGVDEEATYVQAHPFYPPKKIILAKSKKSERTKPVEVKKPARRPKKDEDDDHEEEQHHFGALGPPRGFPQYPPYGGYGYPPYGFPQQFKGYPQPPYGYPTYNPYAPQYGGYGPHGPPRDPRAQPVASPDMRPFAPQPYGLMTPSPGVGQDQRGRKKHLQDEPGARDQFSPFGRGWGPQNEVYIKQEPGAESHPITVEDSGDFADNHGQTVYGQQQNDEIDMEYLDEKSRLDLEAAEAEARLARMRANAAKASRAAKSMRNGNSRGGFGSN